MAKSKNKSQVTENAQLPKWRNRIVGHGEEDPEQLLANPKNWRIHPKNQQDALVGVLTEVGWVQDIIVNKRTGFVVDGHARVALAISAGERVPVVYVDLSEQEEALILATLDPLSAMAATDEDLLAGLVGELEVGDGAVKALLAELGGERIKAGLTDADACPEPPVIPVTIPGDLWLMGEHRVLCGDCTDAETVNRLLGQRNPFLMITDPPYGIELDSEWRDRAGLNGYGPAEPSYLKRTEGHRNTSISSDTRADWSDAFALVPSLEVAYVWHASKFTREVLDGLLRIGFLHHQQIIWNKGRTVLTRTHYWFQHEPCWYVRKKNAPWFGKAGENSTIWDSPSPKFIMGGSREAKFDHPTQKPLELMRKAIVNHTVRGEAVYDPFLGSGTTLIAAEVSECICYGMDIDPKYVELTVLRWQDFTGKEATLDGDNRTFAEVARSRTTAVQSGDPVGAEPVARWSP
jgi:DNA modification methylase